MSKLDLLLKDFYQGESLCQQKMDEILQSTTNIVSATDQDQQAKPAQYTPTTSSARTVLNRQWVAFALVGLLTLGAATYHLDANYHRQRVLAEITLNHDKPFNANISDINFTDLKGALDGASFDVNIPDSIRSQFTLAGARYCSIANQLAVHLQLVDKETAETSSLFITPQSRKMRLLESEPASENTVYWSNQSLFYALLSNDTQ